MSAPRCEAVKADGKDCKSTVGVGWTSGPSGRFLVCAAHWRRVPKAYQAGPVEREREAKMDRDASNPEPEHA